MRTKLLPTANVRTVVLTVVLLTIALTAGTGGAAAHNPACHQVSGPDGPHYDDDPRTGSETASDHNPNLRSVESPDSHHPDHANSIHNREGSCSVGNSQSHHSGD